MQQPAAAPRPTGRTPASMRLRLLTLVAIPLVPAALLVLALVLLQATRTQADAQASAMRVARSIAVAVESRLREVEASLSALAVSPALQEGNLAGFHGQALAFQETTRLGNVVLLDAAGRQVVNTALPLGAPLPALGASAPALPVIRTGKPQAGVLRAALSGKPIAVVSVPVRVGGEVRFALSTVTGFQRFDEILRQQGLPPTWIGVVLDSARVIVARTSDPERFVGVPASKTLQDALAAAPEGAFDGVSLDGVPVRTLYASVDHRGWSVAVGVPKAEFARELHAALLWLSLASLFVFAIGAAGAWWYAERMGRVVNHLMHAARALGHGADVPLAPLGILEADQLAGAMAQAGADLRGATQELARNEARWSAVLDSAMDAIIAIDEHQRIVIYNPAAERIFGWAPREVLGQPVDMLIPPAQREQHGHHVRRFCRTGETVRRMGVTSFVSGLRKDGGIFPMEASISRRETDEGQICTVIARDVTDSVRARQELAQMATEANRVRELEKSRIARELHDELAQSLAVLRMHLARFGGEFGSRGPLEKQAIEAMIREVDASVAATRRIAADLRPLVLDDLGLEAAIDWLAGQFTARTGVPCGVRLDGVNLQEPHATAVFRIVQEALANVAKHAQARRVEVRVQCADNELVLTVVDDGMGFDTTVPRKPQSLGLAGLRERVHLLQGRLTIDSRPGQGTRIEARIPLHAQEAWAVDVPQYPRRADA